MEAGRPAGGGRQYEKRGEPGYTQYSSARPEGLLKDNR